MVFNLAFKGLIQIMMVGLPSARTFGLPHPVEDNLSLKLPGIYSNPRV
jgi:hypothetical protein